MVKQIRKSRGLSSKEAEQLLKKYGLNEIKENKNSVIKIFLHQFSSPLVYLLLLAAVISFFTDGISDGIIISTMILMNTILGFFQEYRSNKTFEKLRQYITSKAEVVRDGEHSLIDKKYLVPGDIVYYKLGDIVAADCFIQEMEELIVDESTITGESANVYKQLNLLENINLKEGILYSGSSIIKGECYAKVFATGIQSKFGKVADLSINTKKKSEFQENLNNLGKWFTGISIVSLIIILILHKLTHENPSFAELFLFTLAIAITIIPEALPVIATITLARGARKLAMHKVIIKKNASIEDLGNIDVICSDKTGTLTKNKLKITHFDSINEELLFEKSYKLSYDSEDPYDIAIFNYVKVKAESGKKIENFENIPFNPKDRYSGRIFGDEKILKGASEYILQICFNNNVPEQISNLIKKYCSAGFRAISIALIKDDIAEYLGTFFFEDEIKEGVTSAIHLGQKQNIIFKIITGDNLNIALNVGKDIDLIKKDEEGIEAKDLDFSNEENLMKQVEQYSIFARTDPEQKYEIIKALQKKYHVGYLGDGINDAPSLALANVGIVVDTASDIAKSTADIILLEKDLRVIVGGILEGRKVFVNIDKFVRHTLSANFGNLYTIGIISVFLNYLPMLPVQIIMNNLLGDFPGLAFTSDNVEVSELKKPKRHTISYIIAYSAALGLVAAAASAIFFLLVKDNDQLYVQSLMFVFATIPEELVIFSMRTKKFIFKGSRPTPLIYILTLLSVAIALYSAIFGWDLIKVVKFQPREWIIFLSVLSGYLIISEIVKILFFKFFKE